ncbi:uncharacterized protein BX663DRAFT_513888 [Cokeromyces recurvatus]|uniref:uncharacterized protein n=1 Tax=Cokeromyces recurvatus TaxID=90255 RepID=UPI00222112AF|nr:uncharacterized protein BX663DRAFT_513888 [Cokeromyces recurvatus]KAI7901741.1 hypothetical protein BX663DRAFT_513888 [Cokeromyces recurvatus]
MLSVRNMLTENSVQQEAKVYSRPSVLDISFLLCSNTVPTQKNHSYLQQDYPYPNDYSKLSNEEEEEEGYMNLYWTKRSYDNKKTRQVVSPYSLLDKRQRRSSRQNQLESKKIEQELLHTHRRPSSSSVYSCSSSSRNSSDESEDALPLKAKRRRASSKQLDVLNKVFERTFFPSTQLRAELGRQLGMSPRTVQIWFQNRRQAIRARERNNCSSSTSSISRENSILSE